MHNAIFLKDKSNCVYLQRSEHNNYAQPVIDEMKSLQAIYLKANCETLGLFFYGNPYLLGLTKELKRFFDKNHFKYSDEEYQKNLNKLLVEYLNILSNSLAVKANINNYYSDAQLQIFSNFRKLLKYQKQFQLPLYKKIIYKYKMHYYLKKRKYRQTIKYYNLLYRYN